MEVRHAVRQLYVKQGGDGVTNAADAWFAVGDGGLIRTPADTGDLPGPCGGHSLHVQRRQHAAAAAQPEEAAQLPKACAQGLSALLRASRGGAL